MCERQTAAAGVAAAIAIGIVDHASNPEWRSLAFEGVFGAAAVEA